MDFKKQIEDYELGKLDNIAKKRFEFALTKDKELKEALNQYRNHRTMKESNANDFIPSKSHLLKTIALAAVLAIGGVGVSNYFQKNTRKTVPRLAFEEVYIKPSVLPESSSQSAFASDIKKYLNGDKASLDSLSMRARNSNSPLVKYWTAELFFREQQIDSMLTYLPSRFNTKDQDRVHYLEIMGYYFLGEDQLVKQATQRLPTSTGANYLLLYNKLIQ